MLGRHMLVVEGDDIAVGSKPPEVVERPVVTHRCVRYDESGAVVSGVGQYPEVHVEGNRSGVGHTRELAGADHADDRPASDRFGHQRPSSRAITMRWISVLAP